MFKINSVRDACRALVADVLRERTKALDVNQENWSIDALQRAHSLAVHREGDEQHATLLLRYLDEVELQNPDAVEVHLSLWEYAPIANYFKKQS